VTSQPIRQQFAHPAETKGGAAGRAGKGIVSVGSILAAIGAASCCVIPFTLATLGISGAWIGNFTALAPYQPYFLGLAALLLGSGFFLVYRKPRASCAEGTYCARPLADRVAKIALWSAAVLVVLAVAFPYAAPRLFDL
jgi:mercuric ion transport protein